MKRFWKIIKQTLRPKQRFSPSGFFIAAFNISFLFFVFHVLGFRHYVSLLSGTIPVDNLHLRIQIVIASGYILLYFATVILVPILIIAAGILSLIKRKIPLQ
jgi:hypothetical protein